jgi:hypothetical protein
MIKKEIDSIKIEHRGEQKYWNITMFVMPLRGNSGKVPCYAELVEGAEDVLRKAKGLDREWFASNAEVMAWSSYDDRGIRTPDRFRVTLDMVTKDMEAPSNEDM